MSVEQANLNMQSRIMGDSRFVPRGILDTVFETSASRTQTLKAGQILWNAQLGSNSRIQDEGTLEVMEVEKQCRKVCGWMRRLSRPARSAAIWQADHRTLVVTG